MCKTECISDVHLTLSVQHLHPVFTHWSSHTQNDTRQSGPDLNIFCNYTIWKIKALQTYAFTCNVVYECEK